MVVSVKGLNPWRARHRFFDNLLDKQSISSQYLEAERENTLLALNGYLTGLGYMGYAQ